MPSISTPTIDRETINKAQNQIIETIEQVQERVIETNKRVAKTVSDRMPEQLTDRLESLPRPSLPKPGAAVDNYFGFVQRVTKANHTFASNMVAAWTPAKTAAKTAAAKSEATQTAEKATTVKKAAAAKKAPTAKKATPMATAEKPAADKAAQ
ncbi:MAG: hypothetical protein ACI8TP_004427 [Acidimicrobiales bacterium]|jgi:hypothetical protein